jgi:hypothetical protein
VLLVALLLLLLLPIDSCLVIIMKFFAALLALPLALAAPVIEERKDAATIPDRWIAVLKDGAESSTLQSVVSQVTSHLRGTKPDTVWDFDGFKGFAFGAKNGLVKTLTSTIAELDFIEQDAVSARQICEIQRNEYQG